MVRHEANQHFQKDFFLLHEVGQNCLLCSRQRNRYVAFDRAIKHVCTYRCWLKKDSTNFKKNRGQKIRKPGSYLKEKQLRMVEYVWEFFYELMMAKDDNVSKSPGFEAIVGDLGA